MAALIASVKYAAKTLTSWGAGKCVLQPCNTLALQYTQQSKEYSNKKEIVSTMVDPKRVVSYEDMLKVIQQPEKVIIDVRNIDEIKATGKIPSSINIPLGEVQNVLTSMSDDEFKKNFQRSKPTSSDELIFYCQSGRRSSEALDKALKLGYSNSKTYLGSWNDWSSRQQ
ncbi:PREDICTED: thiosulfate sulfurtransferase/rhodanese-like domain-containing protein 3 isoform X2 [Papilio xuthus]|uniref:Thiosulfate sulfurtransferase/rhodanese-like domain-containing protein 3 isoform X2 n=1 Tax=Papilio xuthus TaxID=66420 RepID=A0AAJ7E628_PAPXU|nr:PREDICTED: thiosulfate sulfurtransferase/rhodanese-like domain-containing protein 3 isoform X2 [Papilio xuthus]